MPDYVERLVKCGMNLADAWEVCEDFLYDGDYQGLSEYVRSYELDAIRKDNVYRV